MEEEDDVSCSGLPDSGSDSSDLPAAAEARNKREHADQAERRVTKVRQLLKECEDSAHSAENVVVTAMTEAKISEKRAAETEARAARASSTAQKERQRAEEETKKE